MFFLGVGVAEQRRWLLRFCLLSALSVVLGIAVAACSSDEAVDVDAQHAAVAEQAAADLEGNPAALIGLRADQHHGDRGGLQQPIDVGLEDLVPLRLSSSHALGLSQPAAETALTMPRSRIICARQRSCS